MTTYSDAAKAYAVAQHTDEHNPAGGFSEVCGHCKIAAKAYDAGRTDVPAPILLTAGDPRWRDGAKVRGEFADGSAVEGILRDGVLWVALMLGGFSFGEMSAVYLIAGHRPLVLAGVQAVIASLAGPVIFVIGARAFCRPVAGLGAVMATLHPGLLAYTLKLHPLGLDVLLMALMVLWVGRAGEGLRTGVLAGLSLGMSLMSRPTLLVAGVAAMGVRWGLTRRTCWHGRGGRLGAGWGVAACPRQDGE